MIAEVGVLVVGAGPTGRLLAAELQRRGVDTLLIFALSVNTRGAVRIGGPG